MDDESLDGYCGADPNAAKKVMEKRKEPKCHCAEPHHLPVWYCPVHGEVVVPMD